MTIPESSVEPGVKTARYRMVRAVLLVLAAYAVLTIGVAAWSLHRADDHVQQLRSSAVSSGSSSVTGELRALKRNFFWAHVATRGPVWWVGTKIPLLGQNVRAIRTVTSVGDRISHSAGIDLLTSSGLQTKLAPRSGRFDLDALHSLAAPVEQTQRAVRAAHDDSKRVDVGGLLPFVRSPYRKFASQVASADTAATTASRAVRVLPTMLGAERPREYLLLLDTNAELRATGGLPGALVLLKADAGRITLERQAIPSELPVLKQPVLTQSAAEHAIYDTGIAEYPQDTNFTPEFPRTAELLRAMWQRSQGETLDGVFSIDTVTLSYLLRATGPIDVPGAPTLTSENASDELLNTIYLTATNDQQNEFFARLARVMFEKVVGGVQSVPALLLALGQSAQEGRLYVHDFAPAVQRQLSGTNVAGELPLDKNSRSPQVGVYLNDATGAKMSFYLRSASKVTSVSCQGGRQELAGRATLRYTADSPRVAQLNESVTGDGSYGTPIGQQLVLVRIYGPVGGSIRDVRVAGSDTPVQPIEDRGRPVVTLTALMGRGEAVPISWTMASGPGQTRDAQLTMTPGLDPVPATRSFSSSCGRS